MHYSSGYQPGSAVDPSVLSKCFFRITRILLDELKNFCVLVDDVLFAMIDISFDSEAFHPVGQVILLCGFQDFFLRKIQDCDGTFFDFLKPLTSEFWHNIERIV